MRLSKIEGSEPARAIASRVMRALDALRAKRDVGAAPEDDPADHTGAVNCTCTKCRQANAW